MATIVSQRVNTDGFEIRFSGGVVFRRTREQLQVALVEEGTRDRLQTRCIDELRALIGDAANEFDVILAADGTPEQIHWHDAVTRQAFEDAGRLPTRQRAGGVR